jgi:Glutaminase
MATVSLVNGSDSDEIWANMIHNFNNFANTALTVNQEIYKSESATNQHNRGIAWLLDSYGYFYNTPPMIVDLVHPHVLSEHHHLPAGADGRLLCQRGRQPRQQKAGGEG